MTIWGRLLRLIACLPVAALLSLPLATAVAAHTELETATPAAGSTVPSPFDGPIVLTFSEALAAGSKADLLASGGGIVASATVDGPAATMTIALDEALEPGDYDVEWTGIAADGHVERGTVSFTVAPAPPTVAPSPSPSPEPTPSAAPATPSPAPTVSASPAPSPTPPEPANASGGDVVIPIIAALALVGAGAAYLLTRRGRPTPGR